MGQGRVDLSGVYLDYNASAPVDPRVVDAMLPLLTGAEGVGNASSVHRFGRRLAAAVDEAREHVAALVGGRASGVAFTSGATEANNLALWGVVEAAANHASAAAAGDKLRVSGRDRRRAAVGSRPRMLVSAVESSGVDLVSISGHKICGPGGVGALIGTRRALRGLEPPLHGGGHERGLRSGSLNVAGAVGFGIAARIAAEEREAEALRVSALRDRLVEGLSSGYADP